MTARRVLLVLLCCVLVPLAARSADAPLGVDVKARSFTPGELVVFTLDVPPPVTEVRVTVFGRTVAGYPLGGSRWQVLVGIDLEQRPGAFVANVQAIDGAHVRRATQTLTIARRVFPTRTLSVAPDFVNPPPDVLARITQEQAFTRDVFAHSASMRLWAAPFVRPVPQAANSRFGTRSVYNGARRSPHAGTDFLSPSGTPIQAPNGGLVVCARELYFTGNTVIIDHGLGVFSLLAHLSRIDVKEGDDADAGQQLGLVGATGRVTGPHLHWAVTVAGARVDALSVLELLGRP